MDSFRLIDNCLCLFYEIFYLLRNIIIARLISLQYERRHRFTMILLLIILIPILNSNPYVPYIIFFSKILKRSHKCLKSSISLFLTSIHLRVIKRFKSINQRRNQQSTVNWISFAPMSASFLSPPPPSLRYTIKYKIEVWILAPVKIYGSRVLSIPVSRNF